MTFFVGKLTDLLNKGERFDGPTTSTHSAPERHSTLASVGPNAGQSSGSGELAHRRLAIPESHPRSFDEILAETSHTVIGCDAGFVEQRLGSLARTDRFQVSECIHDELEKI